VPFLKGVSLGSLKGNYASLPSGVLGSLPD
jgi:hypothetical protein